MFRSKISHLEGKIRKLSLSVKKSTLMAESDSRWVWEVELESSTVVPDYWVRQRFFVSDKNEIHTKVKDNFKFLQQGGKKYFFRPARAFSSKSSAKFWTSSRPESLNFSKDGEYARRVKENQCRSWQSSKSCYSATSIMGLHHMLRVSWESESVTPSSTSTSERAAQNVGKNA